MSQQRNARRWLLGFGIFTAAGVLFGLQFYVSNSQLGGTSPASAFIFDQLYYWYTWGALFPAVLWVARKVPVQAPVRPQALLLHALAGVVMAYLHAVIYISLYHAFGRLVEDIPFSSESVVQGFFRLNMPMRVLNYFFLSAGILAVDFYQRYVERTIAASRLESELAIAKVQVLRMQMHPHFLFNTLNSIAGLVRAGERPQAVKMIAGLSDLLRAALDTSSEQQVALSRELSFVRRYLEIEQVRFSDRLSVTIDVEPSAEALVVPNLVLQPLVENAINHGIAHRPGLGRISIAARRENGHLKIEVSDDGVGLPEGWDIERDGGIGLKNTRDRLRHLYGDAQSFDVRASAQGGVTVALSIPVPNARPKGAA